ncbi:MAG: Dabb family protein [Pyrinomonadaceae bacterium]|nr:Dabb family protein [Pyrinomonadaceae bacterium]
MLTHIVCWKYKPEINESQREEHRKMLCELVRHIPEIIKLNVGKDVLGMPRSFDSGLVATFTNRESLSIYTDNAEHQKVAVLGREIAEQIVSVDFEE